MAYNGGHENAVTPDHRYKKILDVKYEGIGSLITILTSKSFFGTKSDFQGHLLVLGHVTQPNDLTPDDLE